MNQREIAAHMALTANDPIASFSLDDYFISIFKV